MPFFALIITILMGGLVLGVDLSRLRAEAENAQRAANAAALAGVVYLPDFADSAYTRAYEEARKNGFVTGQRGVAVTPSRVPGYTGRLKITINEPVSLAFGGVFGLVPQTVSRSATAEFDEPVQMGSPDYVLGYAPFPTTVVTSTDAPSPPVQGFFLAQRGRYDSKELGDALSPYFQSFQANGFGHGWESSNGNPNPCIPSAHLCNGLTSNPDHPTNFQGYDYVVDDPVTNTLVIKLFDSYDENGAPGGLINAPCSEYLDPPFNALGSVAGLNGGGIPCNNSKLIDGGGSNAFGSHTTTLKFSLSGPYQTAVDTSFKPITTTPAIAAAQSQSCTAASGVNCVVAPEFLAGSDPAYLYCTAHASCANTYSPYAFRFVNYAIIHGRGIFHIHVASTINADGTEGTHLNQFGIAVCADPVSSLGLGTSDNPSGSSDASNPYQFDPAASPNSYPYTSDPDPAGATNDWNPSSCPSPNTTIAGNDHCPNAGTAGPGQCVHVYANGSMSIHNQLVNGKSLIPLGYVPTEYDGKTLQVRLFDVGDTTQNGSNNTIEVLTPAGDLSHYSTNSPAFYGFPTNLDYTYNATSDPGSGFTTVAETATQPRTTPIVVSNDAPAGNNHFSWGVFNGSWLNIKVPINLAPFGKNYKDMVNGTASNPAFGGYWKVLYNVHGLASDTTTWQVTVSGSPVHLVSGS